MKDLRLTEINVYPVKSLGGFSVQEWNIEERGLKLDRRWMLVDESNTFISQRKFPQLSLLKVQPWNNELKIGNDDFGFYNLNTTETDGKTFNVKVWDSVCEGAEVSKLANEYFSNYLNKKVSLVYMKDEAKRLVDENYASNDEIVSFADGFPILLIGLESLNDLNLRLEDPIPMNRFRPNLVVGTSVPFEEDTWVDFSIGNANFKAVKPCARCIMTTIDQNSGRKGSEPLKTLSTYRMFNNKVMFGQNLLIGGGDRTIRVGDSVTIKSRKI